MKHQQLYAWIIYLLILLWAYAGIEKLLAFKEFRVQMQLQVLPDFVKYLLSLCLPLLEILLAVTLCIERIRGLGIYCSFIFLLAFTVYVGLAVFHFFPKRPCSCGGIFQHVGWNLHLLFNLIFTALNLTAIIITHKKEVPAISEQ